MKIKTLLYTAICLLIAFSVKAQEETTNEETEESTSVSIACGHEVNGNYFNLKPLSRSG